MTTDLPDDLRALLDLARDYLRTREDVRRGVAVVGRALAALAEWAVPGSAPAASGGEVPPPAEAPPETTSSPGRPDPVAGENEGKPAPKAVPVTSLPPLTFATPPATPTPHSPQSANGEVRPDSLAVIADRCRLKAEACDLAARRLAGGDVRDEAAGLAGRAAQLPDCVLWPLDPRDGPTSRAVLTDLAAAFEATAEAADMLRVWWDLPEPNRERAADDVLHLAAEAQAVLYAAVAETGRPRADGDQIHLFVTIREEAARLQVFIRRYLKREDRADRGAGPRVAARVRELASPFRRIADAGRNRHKVLGNLRHKARRLAADPDGNAGEWPRVVQLLDELVAGGLPPSNPDVRDLVLPVFDLLPDDVTLSPNAERVFREIDRYLATRPADQEPRSAETLNAEVAEVRRLLAGRRVVLIGGQVRPPRRDALIEALGLADLDWVTTVDHESVSIFEAPIARPEVAVVLLAIRWSNHSYGDVRGFCDRYGKLLVRLPGGYHPNQVAHQILSQVGNRLRAAG